MISNKGLNVGCSLLGDVIILKLNYIKKLIGTSEDFNFLLLFKTFNNAFSNLIQYTKFNNL